MRKNNMSDSCRLNICTHGSPDPSRIHTGNIWRDIKYPNIWGKQTGHFLSYSPFEWSWSLAQHPVQRQDPRVEEVAD